MQCCGSVTFWYGPGSSNPYLWLTNPDADPGGIKTYGSGSGTPAHFHNSSKIKSHQPEEIKVFLAIFAWCGRIRSRIQSWNPYLWPVLRIHDILGWIRIRIRGSMPLTDGSGSGSYYFRQRSSRCQQNTNFLTQFFLLITFCRYIYFLFQR